MDAPSLARRPATADPMPAPPAPVTSATRPAKRSEVRPSRQAGTAEGVTSASFHPSPAPVREIVRVEVRDPHAISLVDESGDMRKLEELEAEIIRFALQHYRGHMSAVSRRLGIGRSTLYRKLKELGLEGEAA